MSDLEKVLKIAEEIEADRIKKYENILMKFMRQQSKFSLENLDPWILNAGGVQYTLDDLKCSYLAKEDLKQAAKNLGFDFCFSDAITFLISLSDTEISTPAKQFFDNYKIAFTNERARIEGLTQEYYNTLMSNIASKKDIKVIKKSKSFHIKVKLPRPSKNSSFYMCIDNHMETKGFKDVHLSNTSCSFEVPIK